MRRYKRVLGGAVAATILAGLGGPALAWYLESVDDVNHSTHLFIVREALAELRNLLPIGRAPVPIPELPIQLYASYFDSDPCRSLWHQGLYDADCRPQYSNGGSCPLPLSWSSVSTSLWDNHFYDPDSQKNDEGSKDSTALTETTRHFLNALDYASAGRWAVANTPDCANRQSGSGTCQTSACYEMGLALHYMTDATQPMHADNFTWLSFPISYHSDYEEFVMSIQSNSGPYLQTAGPPPLSPYTPTPDVQAIVDSAAHAAKALEGALYDDKVAFCITSYGDGSCWKDPSSKYYVGPTTATALRSAANWTSQLLWLFFDDVARSPMHLSTSGVASQVVAAGTYNTTAATWVDRDDGGVWTEANAPRPSSSPTGTSPTPVQLGQIAGGQPGGLARTAAGVYVTAPGTGEVWLFPSSGTPIRVAIGQHNPGPMVATPDRVYWANRDTGQIMMVPVGGTLPIEYCTAAPGVLDLAVDGSLSDGRVYVSSFNATNSMGTIAYCTGVQPQLVTAAVGLGIRADSIAVRDGTIYAVNTPGQLVYSLIAEPFAWITFLEHGAGVPYRVAVDASSIYFSFIADPTKPQLGTVMRMPRAGGTAVAIAMSQPSPFAVAVDDFHVYWSTSQGVSATYKLGW